MLVQIEVLVRIERYVQLRFLGFIWFFVDRVLCRENILLKVEYFAGKVYLH